MRLIESVLGSSILNYYQNRPKTSPNTAKNETENTLPAPTEYLVHL